MEYKVLGNIMVAAIDGLVGWIELSPFGPVDLPQFPLGVVDDEI